MPLTAVMSEKVALGISVRILGGLDGAVSGVSWVGPRGGGRLNHHTATAAVKAITTHNTNDRLKARPIRASSGDSDAGSLWSGGDWLMSGRDENPGRTDGI